MSKPQPRPGILSIVPYVPGRGKQLLIDAKLWSDKLFK